MSEHDVVIQILKLAHQRMDQRGYQPVTRPIDDRGCSSSGDACSNLGGHTSDPGSATNAPGSDRKLIGAPMSVHSTRRVNPQAKASVT